MIRNHTDLTVWKQAMRLAAEAHRIAARLPTKNRLDLARQIRAAATSIPSNIAEGNGRAHRLEYLNHLSIARGSLRELHTQLELALLIGYLKDEELSQARELLDHVGRMLTKMIQRLRV